jgi:8-oxo-dGTP diphosphatase
VLGAEENINILILLNGMGIKEMKPVRVSTKAIIIENGNILLLKHEDQYGEWYCLPGGGQENGETLKEALIRECMEEIGATIEVKDILFIRDYIAKNHEFKDEAESLNTHQIEIMFECSTNENYIPFIGLKPDSTQKEVLWIELKSLSEIRFYPKEMISYLENNIDSKEKIYLGDIN